MITVSPAQRPLTSALTDSVIALILLATPVRVEEHLIQGWDALQVAAKTEDGDEFSRNLGFARRRIAHARAGLDRVKPSDRAAAAREVENLERLVNDCG